MTTLADFVATQKITGASDIDIIKQWFIINRKQAEGITIISDLSKSKIEELDLILANARTWIPMIPDVYESNKPKLDKIAANNITKLTYTFLLGMKPSDKALVWAKENIPNMVTPKVIFKPMVDWLKDEYGIEFKKE